MEKENKELLLKDLCARLPYGVMIQIPELFYPQRKVTEKLVTINDLWHFNDNGTYIENVKPYLRLMSSMTEEEKNYIDHRWGADNYGNITTYSSYEGGVSEIELADIVGFQDWLNKNMFDYRGLIEKNLAIEVNEDNNPYQK